jgi:response regulator RpfG family c-di-GMP phosphodiesterase
VRVLVVDDLAYNRRSLKGVFQSAGYQVATAEDGEAALRVLRTDRPDVVVTDILMPNLDGFQLCRAMKTDANLAGIAVVFYTGSYTDPKDREFGMSLGAAAYLTKPAEPRDLLKAVSLALGQPEPVMQARRHLAETFSTAYADRLASKLQDKVTELQKAFLELDESYTGTVAALALALASREGLSPVEAERPARLAQLFCERVAPDLAADPNVFRGFLLHDVGKLALPDGLLTKLGALSPEERTQFQRLPSVAADLLHNVPGLGRALEIVRHHTEHWNGSGYPAGLRGETIPLSARVFAVANSFEAMVTGRPYRARISVDWAVTEIRARAGTQFDPGLTEEFCAMVTAMRER